MGLLDTIFGGGDGGFDAARDANNKNRALYEEIALPEYEQWVPEFLNTEAAQYELTSDDPVTRSAQLAALSKMAGLADEGLSDADMAGYTKAVNQGNQVARSGNAAVMNNAIARGVGGSGLEFIMREQANQDGAERAQEAGLQVASDAAKNRALYNKAFLDGTSGMRDQDYRTNANNTSIINQFNQANTNTRNQANQYNTGLKNQSFQYNQDLKDKNYDNQLEVTDRKAGMNNRDAEISSAEAEKRRKDRSAIGGLVGAGVGGYMGGWQGAQAGAGVGQTVF